MSSEVSISVQDISKCFEVYSSPQHRLYQFLSFTGKRWYKEFWGLRNISFDIYKGEIVGIVGSNGSGKSTLLQIVCGTLTPTSGTVQTNGRISALLELGAGFNPEFTGRENVYLNGSILGLSPSEMESKFQDILDFSELHNYIDQPVKTYSSGMYARLAFATAIHVNPEILIIDESLAVGDAHFVAKCMKHIRFLKEQGKTILFVSHDVESVRSLCDRVIWINRGELVETGEVLPVTSRYMEFMFSDTDIPSKLEQNISSTISNSLLNLEENSNSEGDSDRGSANILTHWGTHKGSIVEGYVCNPESEAKKDVFAWGETLRIKLTVSIPLHVSRKNLAVAFSIKSLKGNDVIIHTSHMSGVELPATESFEIEFSFSNYLTPGKYLLVLAIERREGESVNYLEYIEGIQYFASTHDGYMSGIFYPDISQVISN